MGDMFGGLGAGLIGTAGNIGMAQLFKPSSGATVNPAAVATQQFNPVGKSVLE